ncbi:MAG: hypothetical protein ACFFAJ_17205 [Candidatus Hodarchaeota archaeon]
MVVAENPSQIRGEEVFLGKNELISKINENLKNGLLENKALRKHYRKLFHDGTLSKTRFIRFPKIGWRLIEINTELERQLLSIIPKKIGKGSLRILFILRLLLELLGEDINERKPHYLVSSPVIQSVRYTPRTNEPRNCIPESLVEKKLVLRNVWSLNYDKRNGYNNQQYACPQLIFYQFESIFLKKVSTNLKGLSKSFFLTALKQQFVRCFPNKKFKTSQAISANLFELKESELDVLILASTTFYDIYKYKGVKYPQASLKYIEKTNPELYTFFSKMIVLEGGFLPPMKDLKFLVTVSSLRPSLENLVNNYHTTRNLSRVYDLLNVPRKEGALSTSCIITINDIFEAGLSVNFKLSKAKFMREDKKDAITNFALAVFKNTDVLTFIRKKFREVRLPDSNNSELLFTGQHRNGGEFSAIYEDGIIRGKDQDGRPVRVSLMVKNTMLEDQDKHIRDYLKTMHIPNDSIVNILVDVTHPRDVRKILMPNQKIKDDVILNGLGIINIGIYEGFKGVKNLGQIYGVLMQARRSSCKDKVQFAKNKLINYGIPIDDDTKKELIVLNNILEDLRVTEDLNSANWGQIHEFLGKYVERYGKYLSSSR